jgi:hypothetical protein
MTLAQGSRAQVLSQFPSSFEELPEMHRLLLALLAVHADKTPGTPTPWPQLVQDTIRALAGGAEISVPAGGLIRVIEACLGDLADYGLVVPSVAGLSLSRLTLAAEANWNGAFKELVADVDKLLSS